MSANLQSSAPPEGDSWAGCVSSLGMTPMIKLVEDHAGSLASEMTGGAAFDLVPAVHQGLPILVPAGCNAEVSVNAPGEGVDSSVLVSPLLAGLAITAHAAEYLYFGSDKRFPVAQVVKRYKLLVQAEASRLAESQLDKGLALEFEQVLGLEW